MTFHLAHSSASGLRLSYYRQAQGVCQYVQKQVLDAHGCFSIPLQPAEIPRLQRAVFTTGTIYATLGPTNVDRAVQEQIRALELVIQPPLPNPSTERYTLRDMLLATCTAGHVMSSPDSHSSGPDFSSILHTDINSRLGDPTVNLLYLAHASGDQLLQALLRAGGGVLPAPLLLPEQVMRLRTLLFPESKGVFPAICTRNSNGQLKPPSDTVRQQTNSLTSTILLTLAKRFQDHHVGKAVIPGPGATLPVSTSVVILLYYLALAWTPSPSTYNNLGIVLSGISETRKGPDGEQLDGTALARLFYTAGLQLDPKHPHLLTNLGSLLKDQGRIDQAIK